MFQILVVEDDQNTNLLISTVLNAAGYKAISAYNGKEALNAMEYTKFDLMITDIMMPELDGLALTKLLRDTNHDLPILMITAKDMPQDKHKGFLVGTDDYMTKPIDHEEMLFRVKALLRRSQIVSEKRIVIGDVILHYDSLTVSRLEDKQVLPPKEFYLLYKLLAYPGQIFTRNQLLEEIWGFQNESVENTINVHINRLRNRFEHYSEFELISVRGLGYKAVKSI